MTVRWHTGGASDRSTFDTLGGAGELGLRPVLSTHSLPKPSPRVLLRAPPQDSAALDGFAARHYQQQVVILVDDMPLAALTLHPTAFGGKRSDPW